MLKLRRIISSESWVPEIDGLRFVAILSVLIFHCSGEVLFRGAAPLSVHLPLWLFLVQNTDRGVALFFVISGFVLARPFFHHFRLGERPVRLPYYFLRRLTRLEPPYLLCLALYFVAFRAAHTLPPAELARHTTASAFYVHNFLFPGQQPVPNFVTWSLEIEVQFYVLAPLLGQVFRLRDRWVRRGVLVALMLLGCWAGTFALRMPLSILTYGGFFPAGFLLADLFDDPQHPLRRTTGLSWWADAASLLFWLPIFLVPFSITFRSFLPLLIVPAYALVFRGRLSRWIFSRPLLTTLGGMCYSLYLLHVLVMAVAFRAVKHVVLPRPELTYFVQLVLLIVPVVAAGVVYFVLIERPCMNKRWPQDLLQWVRSLRRRPEARRITV